MSSAITSISPQKSLRTLLQVNVACLTALSGAIFACAEGGPIAAATVPIALGALLWTDIRGTFSLNSWIANGLGLLAFGVAGVEFFGESIEGRLLGFGHLLFYLTWILLLQKKGTPQFWWLCALSVLQVATSSVLTNSIWLGPLLILYVLLALWTLSIFTLQRAVQRTAIANPPVPSSHFQPNSNRAENSVSRNGVRLERLSGWITPRFVIGVIANGILSIIVGLAFFVFTPRVWIGSPLFLKTQASAAVRSQTGYSEDVSVGDMGQILENHDLVLEASFSDRQSGEPVDAYEYAARMGHDAPLFRGAVLGEYDNGRWKPVPDGFRLVRPAGRRILNRFSNLVKQEIRLFSIGTQTLFSCGPVLSCLPAKQFSPYESEHEVLGNTFRRKLKDSDEGQTAEAFEYVAYSLPDDRTSVSLIQPTSEGRYARLMTRLPSGLDALGDVARSATRNHDGTPMSPSEAIERLVTLLRDSGEYSYSLNLSIDDPNIDPVLDFLVNRKQGHCEYFASALVLMLRSIDIPARYVSGFKGGSLNTKTGSLEVRQLHTHAWVEAYVDRRWVVLDPTPAARDEAVNQISETSHFWTDLAANARAVWVTGLTLSGDQQRRMFLAPLRDSTGGFLASLRSIADAWNYEGSGEGAVAGNARSAITRILISVSTLIFLIIGFVWLVKRSPGRLRHRLGIRRSKMSHASQIVPFYERFRKMLERRGWQRSASQTPQEFATDLHRQLLSLHGLSGVTDTPAKLTEAFYEVRFGQHELPMDRLQELEASLDELERSLTNSETSKQR